MARMAGKEDSAQELGSLNSNGNKVGIKSQSSQISQDRDRDELQRLGKKQVLRVGLNPACWTTMCD